MAYSIYMIAVDDSLINALTMDAKKIINGNEVKKLIVTTHYFVTNNTDTNSKEFDEIFIRSIEGGNDLKLWHPLRPPRYYFSVEVNEINKRLIRQWDLTMPSLGDDLRYFLADFNPVFELYKFASDNNLGIISFLGKPYDEEEASKAIYPVNNIILPE